MKKLSLDALRAKSQVAELSVLEKISGGNKENCHCVTTITVSSCGDGPKPTTVENEKTICN